MTEQERRALDAISAAWNEFLLLPEEGPHDTDEFRHYIHILQRQIMSRPTRRQLRDEPQR